jgi:hypothetical protein
VTRALGRRRFGFACSATRTSRRLMTIAAVVLSSLAIAPATLASAGLESLPVSAAPAANEVAFGPLAAPGKAVSPQYHPDSATAPSAAAGVVSTGGRQVRRALAEAASVPVNSAEADAAVGTSTRRAPRMLTAERRYYAPIYRERAISQLKNSAVSESRRHETLRRTFPDRIAPYTGTRIRASIRVQTCSGSSYASDVSRACGPSAVDSSVTEAAAVRASTHIDAAGERALAGAGSGSTQLTAAAAGEEISGDGQARRLMLQIGGGLGLVYVAFLILWFWATRFRPGLQRSG